MGKKAFDLINTRFGNLVVLGRFLKEDIKDRHTYWLCLCDCGEEVVARGDGLTSGTTVSCGCSLSAVRQTHGMTKTPTYSTWHSMKDRCLNPKGKDWKNYGGRGIKVCDRWSTSFENFLEDMGEKPKGMTLDRIDVNGNYEPSNCKWSNLKEQNRNRRSNRIICVNDECLCIQAWEDKLNLPRGTLYNRLKLGWTEEKALFTPVRKHK